MTANQLTKSLRKALGRRIEAERNHRSMTLKQLADKAGCGEKTVRNVIKGEHARGATISEICSVLKISVDDLAPIPVSDEAHGSYTKNNFKEYIGYYFVYRRSFSFSKNILRSVFCIQWSAKDRCLHFEEFQGYESSELNSHVDHSQSGDIYISNTVGLLHLTTIVKGAIRLITVSKFRLNDQSDFTMHGIVLTQAQKPLHYQPSAAAIIFEKTETINTAELAAKNVTVLRPNDNDYDRITAALAEVENNIAKFALAPE
jgi:transcriptional regulator with XRE-family HTH domain